MKKKSLYTKLTTLSAAGTIELNGRIIECKGFGSRSVAWGEGGSLCGCPRRQQHAYVNLKKSIFLAQQILKY
jgi:hypothetical protein